MSDAASTEGGGWLSPLARAAAAGHLPDWACASPRRREHMARVAALMDRWAGELALTAGERERWRALGWLHDVLRDADPGVLREQVPPRLRHHADSVLHGPAAAERLAGEMDDAGLNAIRYHTLGHPELDAAGRALYLADFLEPGRSLLREFRAELRARMPHDADAVLVEVVASRLEHRVRERQPLPAETASFWSTLVEPGA